MGRGPCEKNGRNGPNGRRDTYKRLTAEELYDFIDSPVGELQETLKGEFFNRQG